MGEGRTEGKKNALFQQAHKVQMVTELAKSLVLLPHGARGHPTDTRAINSNKRLASVLHRLQQKPSQRSTRELYEQ